MSHFFYFLCCLFFNALFALLYFNLLYLTVSSIMHEMLSLLLGFQFRSNTLKLFFANYESFFYLFLICSNSLIFFFEIEPFIYIFIASKKSRKLEQTYEKFTNFWNPSYLCYIMCMNLIIFLNKFKNTNNWSILFLFCIYE